jgi:hypothetical protein
MPTTHWTCTYCRARPLPGHVPDPPICPACGIDALEPGRLTDEEAELAHLAGFGPMTLMRDLLVEAGVEVHGLSTLVWPRGVQLSVGPEGTLEIEADARHDRVPRWRVRVVATPPASWHPAASGEEVAAWVAART